MADEIRESKECAHCPYRDYYMCMYGQYEQGLFQAWDDMPEKCTRTDRLKERERNGISPKE